VSVRNLDALFHPRAVAVVGASDRPDSLGAVILRNLLDGFRGEILPVNPKYADVAGRPCYASIDALPAAPDLAVICSPAASVAAAVQALAARGTKAAVVITAGVQAGNGGASWESQLLAATRPHGLRILGPNCVGVMAPSAGLNATFLRGTARPGHIAFVSQSGGICAAVHEWGLARGIGLSHLVSLGNSADIDFGDTLDYLGAAPDVHAILLYIESIRDARKFMSAARAAARNKPVIAIKSGRFAQSAVVAATHTGALAGADDVFDAALRRAGVVRVHEIEEMFGVVESLARAKPIHGDRLAILTNGGGPGVMATDTLTALGGRLGTVSPQTIAKLDAILPPTWSRTNPIDIIGDAGPERYTAALRLALDDRAHDALLVLNVPTALASSIESARAVVDIVKDSPRAVLACWMGGADAMAARGIFAQAGIPAYDTPGDAVRAFMHLVEYRKNQETLIEAPPAFADVPVDRTAARAIIDSALAASRMALEEHEAKALLAAYGIPVVQTVAVSDANSAGDAAERIGFPVALKVRAKGVSHKSDVGGVVLDLDSREAVLRACETIRRNLAARGLDAALEGYTVQAMVRRRTAYETILGTKVDPMFGPVILFGHGGTAVDVIRDTAVALPPLNLKLAAELVERTRIARLLRGFRDRPAADLQRLCGCLVQLSQLLAENPEVVELDANPLLVDASGSIAVDARVRLARPERPGAARFAIRPYPAELAESITLRDGATVVDVRPIRPEDEPAHAEFLKRLTPEDVYFRFFGLVRQFDHTQVARFTQIDYDREMAFIAIGTAGEFAGKTLGVVRAIADANNDTAEYAIVVRSDLKGRGLGYALLDKLIRYCAARGLNTLVGRVRNENRAMRDMAAGFGFVLVTPAEPGEVEVRLDLAKFRAS